MASTANPVSGLPKPETLSMGAILKIAPFRRLWYAQIVSNFGDFVALFAVIDVLTFKLHATAQQITGVQIAYLVPIAVLGVMAGVFVDRWPLKPTMVASDFIRGGLVLLLLLCTRGMHFYIVLAAISVISSFFGPAQGVAIRSLVPFHGLRSANALIQQVMFLTRIAGPSRRRDAGLGPRAPKLLSRRRSQLHRLRLPHRQHSPCNAWQNFQSPSKPSKRPNRRVWPASVKT